MAAYQAHERQGKTRHVQDVSRTQQVGRLTQAQRLMPAVGGKEGRRHGAEGIDGHQELERVEQVGHQQNLHAALQGTAQPPIRRHHEGKPHGDEKGAGPLPHQVQPMAKARARLHGAAAEHPHDMDADHHQHGQPPRQIDHEHALTGRARANGRCARRCR